MQLDALPVPRFLPFARVDAQSRPQRVRIPPGLRTRSLTFDLLITPNSHRVQIPITFRFWILSEANVNHISSG
jgi:hypothetical protein